MQDIVEEVAQARGMRVQGFRPQAARALIDGLPIKMTAVKDAMATLEKRLASIDYASNNTDIAPHVAEVALPVTQTLVELAMILELLGQHSETWVSIVAKRESTGAGFDFDTMARTGLMVSMGAQGAALAGYEQGL